MALSNDGGFVATGGADKSAIVLDLSNRQQVCCNSLLYNPLVAIVIIYETYFFVSIVCIQQ